MPPFCSVLPTSDLAKSFSAELQLQRAVVLRPNYPEGLHQSGHLYDQQGQYEQSGAAFQQALKLKPTDENALYNLGLSYYVRRSR